jgi:hypothetical protein
LRCSRWRAYSGPGQRSPAAGTRLREEHRIRHAARHRYPADRADRTPRAAQRGRPQGRRRRRGRSAPPQREGVDQTATKKLARASPVSMIRAGRLVPSASRTSMAAICFETTPLSVSVRGVPGPWLSPEPTLPKWPSFFQPRSSKGSAPDEPPSSASAGPPVPVTTLALPRRERRGRAQRNAARE